jgi:N-acyl-D-amino-acid deacylase
MLSRRSALRVFGAAPLLALSFPAASASKPQWTVRGEPIAKFSALDSIMKQFLTDYHIRAGAVAVARAGKVLYERAYTLAEPGYPIATPRSPFRLASVSKAFTAALIYELRETLPLETLIFPYLGLADQPKDPRLNSITIRHLIDHYGGWDNTLYEPMNDMRGIARALRLSRPPTKREVATYMAGRSLDFSPGEKYMYSNFGYFLLGLAAEKASASAKSYIDLVRERVTGPLEVTEVFLARTRKDHRLPGEGFYDQPGTGLNPEYPDQDVRVERAYGGEGWLTEVMDSDGGLAATAGAVARIIGHYAVWGYGPRRTEYLSRIGSMAGTASYAASRCNLTDWCVIFNAGGFDLTCERITLIGDINSALTNLRL